jgi:hypothetical protein
VRVHTFFQVNLAINIVFNFIKTEASAKANAKPKPKPAESQNSAQTIVP